MAANQGLEPAVQPCVFLCVCAPGPPWQHHISRSVHQLPRAAVTAFLSSFSHFPSSTSWRNPWVDRPALQATKVLLVGSNQQPPGNHDKGKAKPKENCFPAAASFPKPQCIRPASMINQLGRAKLPRTRAWRA
eukprot:6458562-Amphidinium_carterae.1